MNNYKQRTIIFFILIFATISVKSQTYRNVIVISDLDNTYKITHSRFPPKDLWNIFFSQKTYTGMTNMFKKMQKNGAKIFFLSNQTKSPKRNIQKMFAKENIKPDSLILRKSILHSGKKYKFNAIISIIKQYSDKNFILLGDNLAHDQEIYSIIQEKYPQRILQVYMRRITNKKIPKNQIIFKTTEDIIINEHRKGRKINK